MKDDERLRSRLTTFRAEAAATTAQNDQNCNDSKPNEWTASLTNDICESELVAKHTKIRDIF